MKKGAKRLVLFYWWKHLFSDTGQESQDCDPYEKGIKQVEFYGRRPSSR